MALIKYDNKVALNENPSIADINKVKADDMNEIKSVVNENETNRQAMIVNTKSSSTTNAYSCDYINDCNTYSTTEIDTGKKWVDGKPIYRKAFIYTSPITSNTLFTIGNISNLNISDVIYLDYVLRSSSGLEYYKNYIRATNNNANILMLDAKIDGNLEGYSLGENWGNPKLIVIIEYTKTTD